MLNTELDVEKLGREFRANGCVRIGRILQFEAADQIYDCLHHEIPWTLAFREAAGARTLPDEEFSALNEPEKEKLMAEIHAIAETGFQFLYNSYMMVKAYKEGRNPELLLNRLLEYLNSPLWLDFVRDLTGMQNIRKTDAQATRYLPGHFLKFHNDKEEEPEEKRLAAYVLNLTRNWQADWGGLLHFMDDNGNVTGALLPRFNTLTVFSVPANHFVSEVAPYARTPRYAITGWLME